jgi:hypothetical protein
MVDNSILSSHNSDSVNRYNDVINILYIFFYLLLLIGVNYIYMDKKNNRFHDCPL